MLCMANFRWSWKIPLSSDQCFWKLNTACVCARALSVLTEKSALKGVPLCRIRPGSSIREAACIPLHLLSPCRILFLLRRQALANPSLMKPFMPSQKKRICITGRFFSRLLKPGRMAHRFLPVLRRKIPQIVRVPQKRRCSLRHLSWMVVCNCFSFYLPISLSKSLLPVCPTGLTAVCSMPRGGLSMR